MRLYVVYVFIQGRGWETFLVLFYAFHQGAWLGDLDADQRQHEAERDTQTPIKGNLEFKKKGGGQTPVKGNLDRHGSASAGKPLGVSGVGCPRWWFQHTPARAKCGAARDCRR